MFNKKLLISTTAIIAMLATSSFADIKPSAKNYDYITLNGKLNNKLDAITYHNTNFINAGVLARELGLEVEWSDQTVTIKDNKKKNVVKAKVGDVNIYKNDKNYLLFDAPFIKDGRIYVPIRTVCELLGNLIDFTQNPVDNKKTIQIIPVDYEVIASSQYLGYDKSLDSRFGVSASSSVFIIDDEFPMETNYSKIYLMDFNTKKHYKLGHTQGDLRHAWTENNQLLFKKVSLYGPKNKPNKKEEVLVLDLNNIEVVDRFEVKDCKYDFNKNILYYSSNNSNYVRYDLSNYTRKSISKKEFSQLKFYKF